MAQKNAYKETAKRLVDSRVLVIGDVMLDRFIYGNASRISPEAPVPVVHVQSESMCLGASGNVARNIAELGGRVSLCAVVGEDAYSQNVYAELDKHGISSEGVVSSPEVDTISKTRIVSSSQQIVRIDRERLDDYSKKLNDAVIERTKALVKDVNVIIISDYAKGLISRYTISKIKKLAEAEDVRILVDPSVKHFSLYKNVYALTPNLKEAVEGAAYTKRVESEQRLRELAKKIKAKLKASSFMITLGADGIAVFSDEIAEHEFFIIPARARSVFDVSGAGDTVIAVTAMGLSCGLSFFDSAYIANCAAGVVVEKTGTACLNMKELVKNL